MSYCYRNHCFIKKITMNKILPIIGDYVIIQKCGVVGKVIKIENNKIIIQSNSLQIETSLANIIEYKKDKIEQNTISVTKQKNKYKLHNVDNFNPEIDLHGFNVEDAINKVDKFIDTAIVSEHHVLKIIHGKGEGILRSSLRKNIKKDKRVKKIIKNHPIYGGFGVTWIELN